MAHPWPAGWSLSPALLSPTHSPPTARELFLKLKSGGENLPWKTLQRPPVALKIKFKPLAVPCKALSDLVSCLQPHPAAPCSLHTHLAVGMSGLAVTCPLPPPHPRKLLLIHQSPLEHPLPAEPVPEPGPPPGHSGGIWTHVLHTKMLVLASAHSFCSSTVDLVRTGTVSLTIIPLAPSACLSPYRAH